MQQQQNNVNKVTIAQLRQSFHHNIHAQSAHTILNLEQLIFLAAYCAQEDTTAID